MDRLLKYRQWISTPLRPEGEFIYWGWGVMPDTKEFVAPADPSLPSHEFTSRESIDGIKVYEGDFLQFLGDREKRLYEVRWDPDRTGFGIFYKDMNFFGIGMSQVMIIVGNKYEGEITE